MSGEKSVADADATFLGRTPGDRFGEAVAVGTLVGDETYLVVGSPRWDSSDSNVGAVFIFDGQSEDETDYSNAELVIEGEAAGGLFGSSVADLSDVNGDGLQDLAVGASGIASGKGQVYLFLSPLSFSVVAEDADIVWYAEEPGAGAGSKIQMVGDLNGDGYTNVGIGAPLIDRVYIPSNTEPGQYSLTESEIIAVGPSDSTVGSALAYAGDINGDSSDDLLLGGYIASTAYVAYGPLQGTINLADTGSQLIGTGLDQAGFSVYSAGDLDADGDSEILIGAKVSTVTLNKQGAVFLVEGMGL